jgi:hypothetical protein
VPANEDIVLFETSDITGRATAAITGKRFVDVSAAMTPALNTSTDGGVVGFAPAGAGVKAFGVAVYDQPVTGGMVGVIGTPGRILPVTAGGTIAAGAEVETNASGQAITLATGKSLGKAVTAATSGNDVFIKLH